MLVSSLEAMGRYREAAAIIRTQRCWGILFDADELLAAYESGGPRAYWTIRLAAMNADAAGAPPTNDYPFVIANLYLGELDRALDHVDRMVETRASRCVFIGADPCLAPLRGNPRYDALVTQIGVPLPHTASAPHTALR